MIRVSLIVWRLKAFINRGLQLQVEDNNEANTIWLKLPYLGHRGEALTKKCIKKLNRLFNNKVKFVTQYSRP